MPALLVSLISLINDSTVPIAKDACLCLVNISAIEKGASNLINLNVKEHCPPLQKPPNNIVQEVLHNILDLNSHIADQCCMILSNLSRYSHLTETVIDMLEESNKSLDDIINVFTRIKNKNGAKLYYLGPVLSNLSQSSRVRMFILDKSKCVIQRLLPFTEYKDSVIKRGGVIGTLKNCCFEEDYHEWLLSDEVDILPRLLLPLAGNEEFDDQDNEKLPLDLQYLPETKLREEDPDIRFILIEALTQLVSAKTNREFIRDKNTYVILRELHKWEKDKKVLIALEHLVNILIRLVHFFLNHCTFNLHCFFFRTEEEINQDNLKDVDIPTDVMEQLKLEEQ